MTSKDPGTSEHALIDLIYRHLKENGYKKAARALKQHVPQVQTTNVNVALEDIFQKWQSKERETEIIEGKAPQTGSVSTTNAAHDTKPEKKLKSETIQPEARQRKRKRSKTELCKGSSPVEDHKTGEDSDSDSDSSLDVEKWRRLALELSDADFAKMDAFSKSTAKSTKRQKLAQPKNHRSPKQTKARTATSRIKTDKKKQTKKKSFSSNDSDNISTPSNYAVFAEPNEKRPESTTASRLLDQCAVPKIDVSNGLSESDETNFTHKHTKKHRLSKSHIMDTPNKKAEIEKMEHKPADSPYKKTKSKKNISSPGRSEAPSKVTDSDITIQTDQRGESSSPKHVLHSQTDEIKAKKDKSKKAKIGEPVGMDIFIQTDTRDATGSLSSDHSKISRVLDLNSAETPSKNAKSKKSKKSKKHQSPGDVAMPTGECESEVYHSHSNQYQAESLSVSVKTSESESAVKQSKKTKKSLSETNWTEKPSKEIETQAATSILEPISSEIQSKKSKTKKALEADQVHSISQKAAGDVGDGEAMKNSSSKSDHTEKKSKKTKRRRADSSGQNVTSSEMEHVSEEQYSILMPAGNGVKHQDQESGFAVNEIGTLESKRRKKKKKDKEKNKESNENVEEAPPTPPPAEECADLLPRNQKKKKKKKQKHGEEVPSVFTPGPEVDTPKKKKKFSKKNEHADVSLQELI